MAFHNRKISLYFFLINIVLISFYLPSAIVSVNATYPETSIVGMWVGSNIPNGWEYLSWTNDLFMYGDYGDALAVGGEDTHSHLYTQISTHNHGITSVAASNHNHVYIGGGPLAYEGVDGSDITTLDVNFQSETYYNHESHTHTVNPTGEVSCHTEYETALPPYQTVKFIRKVEEWAFYPKGLILISTSGIIPSGWTICNGQNGTPDLRGDFVRGSSTPNSTGGSETHRHVYTEVPQHTHSMNYNGISHAHNAFQTTIGVRDDGILTPEYNVLTASLGQTETHSYSHTHSVSTVGSSICYTSYASHIPVYLAVDFIMCTQETPALPEGIVAIWTDSLSTIPFGWTQCDGTSGSIDFRGKYLRGRDSENLGSTGGSTSHSHTYSSIPSHTHTIEQAIASHSHTLYNFSGYALGGGPVLVGDGFPVYSGSGYRYTSKTLVEHTHDINSAGSGTSHGTYTEGNFPRYLRVHFIQCNYYEADDPIFINRPSDLTLEYGYSEESISWLLTDENPDDYEIYQAGPGTVVSSTPWFSEVPIIYNIPDGFAVGTYSYGIEIWDKFRNSNLDFVNVHIVDTTSPLITQTPAPITVEYGYTGQSLSWTATDYHPNYYQIERLDAGIVVGPSAWTSGDPVVYNIPDGIGVGTYEFNITFIDDYGNLDFHLATFTVEDTTRPSFSAVPEDIILEHGYTEVNISWTGLDPYPNTYTIDQDDLGVIVGPLTWTSGTKINFTIPEGLEVGIYSYTIDITDIYGNYQSDSMNVTVEDTTPPIIGESASDLIVDLDYSGINFSWVVTDPYAENYTIELEGFGIVEGPTNWISGSNITYSIPDGLSEGIYSYILNVTDKYGNHANHLVTLTIIGDHEDPVIISFPDDITLKLGYSDQILTWTATDLHPSHYIIEMQDSEIVVDSTAWISGESVMYTIGSGLTAGSYTYIITFYDEYGNLATDSVVFTVENPDPDPKIPGFNVPIMLAVALCLIVISEWILKRKLKTNTRKSPPMI